MTDGDLDTGHVTCALCGRAITGGRVAGGWSATGPGAHYHALLEECGPPLPLPPLPVVRLSGSRGPWPSDRDIERLVEEEADAEYGDGDCALCGRPVKAARVRCGGSVSGPMLRYVRHDNPETECGPPLPPPEPPGRLDP